MATRRQANTGSRGKTDFFFLVVGVAALVAADQLTKFLIRSNLNNLNNLGNLGLSGGINVLGLLQIVHVSNTGSVFGVLKGTQPYISVLSMAVVAFLIIIYKGLGRRIQRLGAVFVMAGAIGNTIDRLVFGRVTDFIYVSPWPAFNLADTFLFIGALFLASAYFPQFLPFLIRLVRGKKGKGQEKSGSRKESES